MSLCQSVKLPFAQGTVSGS